MICVECDELVPSLHTSYQNGHIKLTDCQKCGRVADKYVEYDNVLLFIDILLMKPQAYKHLVYNLISASGDTTVLQRRTQRIRFISILFEIYLIWAYKEKEVNSATYKNPYLIYHRILEQSILYQYMFFALKCFLDDILTHTFIHVCYLKWMKWIPKSFQPKSQINNSDVQILKLVLSMTILISGGMKLFPILMLIWPYDNTAITGTIGALSTMNLIESLRLVTNLSWAVSAIVFMFVTVSKTIITKTLLILILSRLDLDKFKLFAYHELIRFISQFSTIKALFSPYV
jgi:hypothetical protein